MDFDCRPVYSIWVWSVTLLGVAGMNSNLETTSLADNWWCKISFMQFKINRGLKRWVKYLFNQLF